MKFKYLISLFAFAFCSTAWAGNSVGNGGDIVAAQFAKEARNVLRNINFRTKITQDLIDDVSRAIATTTVRSRPQVFLNKHEVDAINYPAQRLIIVSESRWASRKDKARLVMHEYVWVAGYDDSDYSISEHLVHLSRLPSPIMPIPTF